jgi:hypothetical protein
MGAPIDNPLGDSRGWPGNRFPQALTNQVCLFILVCFVDRVRQCAWRFGVLRVEPSLWLEVVGRALRFCDIIHG